MAKFKIGDRVKIIKLYETDKKYTKLLIGVEGIIVCAPSVDGKYGVEFYYPLVEDAKFDLFGTAYYMYDTQLEKVPPVDISSFKNAPIQQVLDMAVGIEGIIPKSDMVNHPAHYTMGKYEVIDVIEDWKLSYPLGNAVKYIARSEHKGNKVQDLEKAIFYIKREIKKLEGVK